MIRLYIGNKNYSSWSMRPWVLLRQAGIDFEEIRVRFDSFAPGSQFRQTMDAITPVGKVPVLDHDGLVVWDTLAIAEYLAEQFPSEQLWPTDIAARAQARSACAQMHSGFFAMRNHMPFNLGHDAPLNPVPPEVKVDVERMLALWAECRAVATEPGPFLFGRVSLADAFFAPIAVRLRTYQVQLPAEDEAYVETVYQWPAFKAWQKAGLEELQS